MRQKITPIKRVLDNDMPVPQVVESPVPPPTKIKIVKKTLEPDTDASRHGPNFSQSEAEKIMSKPDISESEPEPEPEPEPETNDQPEPETNDQSEAETNDQPEPEAEQELESNEDDEEEYGLHPQLQEILEYLADDEHVNLIRENQINELTENISTIKAYMTTLTEFMSDLKTLLANQSQSPSVPVPVPIPESDLLHIEIKSNASDSEPEPEPSPEPSPEPEPEDPLAKLITEYAKSEPISDKGIKFMNEHFDATYIYNYSGRAERYKKYLEKEGIHNCIVIAPDIPVGTPANLKIVYYLKSVLDSANKNKYNRINVIGDVVLIHKELGNVMFYLKSMISKQPWNVLQYCCMDHKHRSRLSFDWQCYLDTNPDLTYTTESEAAQHWESIGSLQGRVPCAMTVPTDSNNTLAFALNSTVYPLLERHLDQILNMDKDAAKKIGVLDFKGVDKAMALPNLFILPKTGRKLAQSMKWFSANYAF